MQSIGVFDYIIVGAGSAGCVLANRLSEDPDMQVCIVEAGPEDSSPLIHIPLLGLPALFAHERMNWRFMTTAQPHAANRSMYVPRGKVLGGSSAINGMVYIRGHPRDYDDWNAAGNSGWSCSEVLPYFVRAENNHDWKDSVFHGTQGPLGVTHFHTHNPVTKAFLDAAKSHGIDPSADFNGPDPTGAGYRQVTQRNGRRASSSVAYLHPVKQRKNLKIVTDAEVSRLVFDGMRATGIRLSIDGKTVVATARREVIISAGTIGSPHILLMSGIGDRTAFAGTGIEPFHHLPAVGYNLQEHATIFVVHRTRNAEPYGLSAKSLPRIVWGLAQYLLFRRGFLASNAFEAGAFVKSRPSLERPDIQLSLMTALPRSTMRKDYPAVQFGYGHGYSLTAVQLRPHSRGRVSLPTQGAENRPVIDPRFLEDDRDVDALLTAVKLARGILDSPSFDRYRSTELAPGKDVQTDDELRDYIRANAGFAFHPVGTCAMGCGADAVVDPSLRVHGIQGLRVVDASIMPTIPGGNTNAPTIMIAEKAADMILGRPPLRPIEGALANT